MTFPSTMLAQSAEPIEIQKADLDLLDKINKIGGGGISSTDVPIITKANQSYTVQNGDLPATILISAVDANRTLTLPAAAENANKWLRVMRIDTTAAYVVTVDGEGAEVIYNGGAAFASLGIADSAALRMWMLWCDGAAWYKLDAPAWHKVANPATGWLASKTTGWTADSFSGGLTVDFSSVVPVGTKAVRVQIDNTTNAGTVYYRKGGDRNVSNTPNASGEISHQILYSGIADFGVQVVIWLSATYTADFSVNSDLQDLYIAYPVEYLL